MNKETLKKYAHGLVGMSATLLLLYFGNKLHMFTPQTENYWDILILSAMVCFVIGVILLYNSKKNARRY